MSARKPRYTLYVLTIAALAVALSTLLLRGLLLPWSEEGVLFALYGAGVGFALAILCNMALIWLMRKNHRP